MPWQEYHHELAHGGDRFSLFVANVTFDLYENDDRLIEFGKQKRTDVIWAASATEVAQD